MEPNNDDQMQETRPLDLDVVADLEQIVRRLRLGAGHVTIEAVFADGSYMRGFVKQGPLTAQQMRELGAARPRIRPSAEARDAHVVDEQ